MNQIKWNEEGGTITIGLPGDLDLAMSGPLTESLRSALAAGKPVVVNADLVERISSAPIQALLIASREAAQQNQSFAIHRPSEVVSETCDDLGLAGWLEQWSQQ